MLPMKLAVGDIAELKKNHPCGGAQFKILRVGSDIRIICLKCGRDMVIERIKFERSVKKINSANVD
jgi:hypothetical protein